MVGFLPFEETEGLTRPVKPISGFMASFLRRVAGPKHRDYLEVLLSWNRIVGELASARTTVLKLQRGAVWIGVENNVWMQELVLRKEELLNNLRALSGVNVRELLFVIETRK